jgi:hypothetical protein
MNRRTALCAVGGIGLGTFAPTSLLGAPPPVGLEKTLAGKWTYRSFLNDPDINKPFNDLRFAAAVLEFEPADFGTVRGRLWFDEDYLALKGTVTYGHPFALRFQGVGGTKETDGWVYDYQGFLVPTWPNGIDQRTAVVGSVIRTVPHSGGKAKAGFVASFIAVRQG